MGDDVTHVLAGLGEYRVLDAVECDGEPEITVEVARAEAPCPGCGTFSARVKQRSIQRVRDGLSFERPTVVVWRKRRFRCNTPGCRASFTESTELVPPRARLTTRLRIALGRAGRTRTAEVHGRDLRRRRGVLEGTSSVHWVLRRGTGGCGRPRR